jgi:protein-glucosylgalactosylhydroxylysine glucosidase
MQVYEASTRSDGPAMTWGVFCTGWLDVGDFKTALSYFPKSYANVREPFKVSGVSVDSIGDLSSHRFDQGLD